MSTDDSDDEYMVTLTSGGNRVILHRMDIAEAAAPQQAAVHNEQLETLSVNRSNVRWSLDPWSLIMQTTHAYSTLKRDE